MSSPFYHSTIKKLITIFGSLFDEIEIEMEGLASPYSVPIVYSPREKFLVNLQEDPSKYDTETNRTIPTMGYEIVGMNYASERATNQINTLNGCGTDKWQHNSVPYDFQFNLYIATKQFDDSLRIVEQILPMFKPAFNVTVNDNADISKNTDVSISLSSVNHEIDYEDSFQTARTINWTLSFTMKAFVYSRTKQQAVIKEAIVSMSESESAEKYRKFTAAVEPRSANKSDPHKITLKVD